MWWVAISELIDMIVVWLGAAIICFMPIAIVLGLLQGLQRLVAYIRTCFRHAFFPSLEDDKEEAVDARVAVEIVPQVNQKGATEKMREEVCEREEKCLAKK